jgi:diguanylate cyclase (GGDEF)-like protein
MQHYFTNRQMVENTQIIAELSVDSLGKDISGKLSEKAILIEAAGTFIARESWSNEEALAYLTALLDNQDLFFSIYFGSSENAMINSSGWQPPADFDLRTRPWYTKAVAENKTVITDAFLNASIDRVIVTIASPVYNSSGRLLGVVGGDVVLDEIVSLVETGAAEWDGISFLVDGSSKIIAHTEINYSPGSEMIDLYDRYETVAGLLNEEGLQMLEIYLGNSKGYLAYLPLAGTDWHLATFIPLSSLSSTPSEQSTLFLLLVIITTFLLFISFVLYHNHYINKPLLRFEQNLEQIDLQKCSSYRLPVEEKTEFSNLGKTVNLLLDKTQSHLEKLEENEASLKKANRELEDLLQQLTTVEEALDYSEEKLYYLSYHDQLTGLYNRPFFEAKLRHLGNKPEYPVTIISADIDGLKLINDTMGQNAGNELIRRTAAIISEALDGSGILARVGGDEFSVILPLTSRDDGERIMRQIRYQVSLYNQENSNLPLSLSLGVATSEDKGTPLKRLFKEADDLMFRAKLYHSTSARNDIVQSLLAALSERDYFSEGYNRHLEKLCLRVGEKAGLSSHQLTDLALLAQVHDLGKVGIPDHILYKKGLLTEEEQEIMKQHPEKGFRIASSASDLAGVANLILKHHEHWNGSGYPLGLKDINIPVECRILAVVDAYEAMTSGRPYHQAVSPEEALDEISKSAGEIFDPEIVNLFKQVIKEPERKHFTESVYKIESL